MDRFESRNAEVRLNRRTLLELGKLFLAPPDLLRHCIPEQSAAPLPSYSHPIIQKWLADAKREKPDLGSFHDLVTNLQRRRTSQEIFRAHVGMQCRRGKLDSLVPLGGIIDNHNLSVQKMATLMLERLETAGCPVEIDSAEEMLSRSLKQIQTEIAGMNVLEACYRTEKIDSLVPEKLLLPAADKAEVLKLWNESWSYDPLCKHFDIPLPQKFARNALMKSMNLEQRGIVYLDDNQIDILAEELLEDSQLSRIFGTEVNKIAQRHLAMLRSAQATAECIRTSKEHSQRTTSGCQQDFRYRSAEVFGNMHQPVSWEENT